MQLITLIGQSEEYASAYQFNVDAINALVWG